MKYFFFSGGKLFLFPSSLKNQYPSQIKRSQYFLRSEYVSTKFLELTYFRYIQNFPVQMMKIDGRTYLQTKKKKYYSILHFNMEVENIVKNKEIFKGKSRKICVEKLFKKRLVR